MAQANRIRPGTIIMYNGDLCRVMSVTHLTPGNLRAMVQAKMRNLKTGVQFENRYRATEDVEVAYLEKHKMEYLYDDGDRYHFMNQESFEQVELPHDLLGDAIKYILPNTAVEITFHEGNAVGVDLPKTVELKVVEADASMKKATASAQYKNATLETGLIVQVPPFVNVGDVIRIDTETEEYLERVSK